MPHFIDWRLLKFLTPKRVRLKLCKARLLPYFFYCDVVFSYLSSVDSRRLPVAFNSCTRYVFNLVRYDQGRTSSLNFSGIFFQGAPKKKKKIAAKTKLQRAIGHDAKGPPI
jgi:hypothetical protein